MCHKRLVYNVTYLVSTFFFLPDSLFFQSESQWVKIIPFLNRKNANFEQYSYQKIGYHPNVNADVHLTSDLKHSQMNFMKSKSLAVIASTAFLFNFIVRGASKALPVWTGLSNWNQKNIALERIGITQASMQCMIEFSSFCHPGNHLIWSYFYSSQSSSHFKIKEGRTSNTKKSFH